MRILYCLLLTIAATLLSAVYYRQGHPFVATLMAFAVMGWLLLLADAIRRRLPDLASYMIKRSMRTPYVHLTGYMERFWLVRLGRRGGGQSGAYPLVGARVHHILRSDEGRDFHDHPWPYLTIILRGGYWEVRPVLVDDVVSYTVRTWHGPGSVLLRRANSWHMLELPEGQTAWTLFCTGPKVQHWGFLVGRKKVGWREYLGVPAGVGED